MTEYWIQDADTLLDYIKAAEVFGYQFSVERSRHAKDWHLTIYTDKFLSRAQQAADAEAKWQALGGAERDPE